MVSKPIRILISRTDGLGDNLLGLPIANDPKTAFPSCRVTWMANEAVAPLISMDHNVDEVWVWDGVSPTDYLEPKLNGNFDAALVLHPKPKEWLPLPRLLRQAGIPIRVGTGRRW